MAALACGFLIVSLQTHAAITTCVHNATELQAALTAAETSSSTTFIDVARGTYSTGGNSFTFTSTGGQQLDVTGGYSSDCSTIIKNPALTILDASGARPVMAISNGGGVSVRYLTFQNGLTSGSSSGGLTVSSDGGIIVDYNIIRNNIGSGLSGINLAINSATSTANLEFSGNLVVGNSTSGRYAAGAINNDGMGNTYIVNNTIANNTSGSAMEALAVSANTSGSEPPANLSNNIFWNNGDFDMALYGHPILTDNDYLAFTNSANASSGGNVSVDPQFSSSSDFHLLPTSPVLGAGTLTPAGGLPTIDIEGHPRSYNSLVDMGAYERGDKIFADGYDN
jgi:hypothetical protein